MSVIQIYIKYLYKKAMLMYQLVWNSTFSCKLSLAFYLVSEQAQTVTDLTVN
jgi:glycopeptide antibiotics resistance protein